MVIAPAKEHHGDTFQPGNVVWRGEVIEERAVGGDEAAVAHLHERVEEGHVDAAEEAVDLSVCTFV